MQRSCSTCAAFAPPDAEGGRGECRASPPTVFMLTGRVPVSKIETGQQSARIAIEFIAAFPPMLIDGWCAAWRREHWQHPRTPEPAGARSSGIRDPIL